MTQALDPISVIGRIAVDATGDKIGKIAQVYLDDQTGQPTWVTVSTGLLGGRESFAPLFGAPDQGDSVMLGVGKSQVKGAPNVEDEGHLEPREERALYDYYADYFGTGHVPSAPSAPSSPSGETGGPGHDVSGPNTDTAMTRYEEQPRVGTEILETGHARLRKYIVTENVQHTLPVSHEEVRVEREPITEANLGAATDGPAISEEEHELTLHAERPVVQKEAVPVERVRIDIETVTENQTVNEQVRKEQIDTDVDGGTTRPE